jgi:predicted Zn-dependent protease
VWAEPFDDVFEQVVRRAVEDWNALIRDVLEVRAFVPIDARDRADVTIAIGPRGTVRKSWGQANVHAGADGEVALPVRITVFGPPVAAAGPTINRETALYSVVAHELGHALGLPHVSDPRSLMCCLRWRENPDDRAILKAYWEAMRHPDVRSVRDQLAEHYAAFWAMDVP